MNVVQTPAASTSGGDVPVSSDPAASMPGGDANVATGSSDPAASTSGCDANVTTGSSDPVASTSGGDANVSFYQLVEHESPCQRSSSRAVKRKVWHSTMLTSSPYKAELETAKVKKSQPMKRAKPDNGARAMVKKSQPMKRAEVDNGVGAKTCVKPTKTKRASQLQREENQSKKSSGKQTSLKQKKKGKRSAKKSNQMDSSSEDDEEAFCLVCTEPYSNSRSKEVWIQCTKCEMWAHELCTDRVKNTFYVCDNCDSDSDVESD